MSRSNTTSAVAASQPPAPDPQPAPTITIRPEGCDVRFAIPLKHVDAGRRMGVLMIGDTPHYIEALEVRVEGDMANVAVNPAYQGQVDRALDLCGDGPLCTTGIGGREHVVVLYPFAD